MRKIFPAVVLVFFVIAAGCGYTTHTAYPSHLKTIYVEPFENNINYTEDLNRGLYVPLLEVKVREAVIDRFQFDGHLRIGKPDDADLILKGSLLGFERNVLRRTESDDVEEYRIHVIVDLTMLERVPNTVFWEEKSFVGESTYFLSGPSAKSEAEAIDEALLDLGRRVVERGVESW